MHHPYCWNPLWSHPYESLWSLLQKFAYFNSCQPSDIRNHFMKRGGHEQKLTKFYPGDNHSLLHFGNLDVVKLGRALFLTENELIDSTVLPFLRPTEILEYSSTWLRYCPDCVNEGYHSPIHQLLFIFKCPYHNKLLTTKCPVCESSTAEYLLINGVFKVPFACNKCKHIYWQGLTRNLKGTKNISRDQAFEETAIFLKKRISIITVVEDYKRWTGRIHNETDFETRLRKLPKYWGNLLEIPTPKYLVDKNYKEQHVFVTCGFKGKESKVYDYDFYCIYKAIRRHFLKNLLRGHLKCIRAIGKHITWDATLWDFEEVNMCPYAHAFLMWRMYWERVERPSYFFSKHILPLRKNIAFWDAPSRITNWAVFRIFGLECLSIFNEFLYRAKRMRQKRVFSFPIYEISNRLFPYWEIVYGSDKKLQSIHWWMKSGMVLYMTKARASKNHHLICDDRIKHLFGEILNTSTIRLRR